MTVSDPYIKVKVAKYISLKVALKPKSFYNLSVRFETSLIAKKDTVLIFTYAPVGLGHLRVTDALYHGLPEEIPHLILAAEEKAVTYLHRLTSIHPLARMIFETTQKGIPEDIFTYLYRRRLRKKTNLIYQKLLSLLNKRKNAKVALIISTHFGLAYKIGQIKEKVEKETGVKVVLVLQVTDDSPQHIWYVPEADIIFVPSRYTKEELLKYAKKADFRETQVEVIPYPVSPQLNWQISEYYYQNRVNQLTPKSNETTHVFIPISGAAVGMDYFLKLTDFLHQKSSRFKFHIVVKKTVYTQFFLTELAKRNYIEIHAFKTDREVVDEYENEYKNKGISIEITKPSEQAFKVFLNPTSIGGSILLFTQPIGRQEYDNLNFLRKHYLIAENELQKMLWKEAQKGVKVEEGVLNEARTWRGLRISNDPQLAADFIFWSLEQGIFYEMLKFRKPKQQERLDEVSPDGVEQFWHRVEEYLNRAL